MKYCAIDFHAGGWVRVGICMSVRSAKEEVTLRALGTHLFILLLCAIGK